MNSHSSPAPSPSPSPSPSAHRRTKRGHCRVVIQATSLSIKVGEVDASGQFRLASLVDGSLFQEVDPSQSRWDFVEATAMGTAELQVTLRKKQAMRWLMLVR